MKRIYIMKTSVRSIVLLAAAIALTLTATGAYSSRVQATLSPDVTVMVNGVRQEFRDAVGNAVYPIIYEGTTYLPVRPVAALAGYGVEWDGDTRTVSLSNLPSEYRARLIDVCGTGYGVTKTTGLGAFPGYSSGLELTRFNYAYMVESDMPLKGSYRELSFDYTMVLRDDASRSDALHLRLFNADTNVLLWEGHCGHGEIVCGVIVDICGASALRWTFIGGAGQSQAAGYILDPYVR